MTLAYVSGNYFINYDNGSIGINKLKTFPNKGDVLFRFFFTWVFVYRYAAVACLLCRLKTLNEILDIKNKLAKKISK